MCVVMCILFVIAPKIYGDSLRCFLLFSIFQSNFRASSKSAIIIRLSRAIYIFSYHTILARMMTFDMCRLCTLHCRVDVFFIFVIIAIVKICNYFSRVSPLRLYFGCCWRLYRKSPSIETQANQIIFRVIQNIHSMCKCVIAYCLLIIANAEMQSADIESRWKHEI